MCTATSRWWRRSAASRTPAGPAECLKTGLRAIRGPPRLQTIQHLIRCSLGVAVVTTGDCRSCGFRPQISLPNGTAVADYRQADCCCKNSAPPTKPASCSSSARGQQIRQDRGLRADGNGGEARMRANGERPPRGDIHTAAVEEVAETADMKPEALMKRIQRLRGRVPGGRT
jgi:hypothetical protein